MIGSRKVKKTTSLAPKKYNTSFFLECKECSREIEVRGDIKAVICDWCVQNMLPREKVESRQEKSDKPRGWHFKKFFEHNGVCYSHGEEITDKNEIARLRKEAKKQTAIKKPPQKKRKK
jgi:hypothetical protein